MDSKRKTESQILSLDQLRPGQVAEVVKINGNGPFRRRFLEMGFVKGELIKVERVAPLGDPVQYRVKGYHLSLRRSDAAKILVRKAES